jgi:putative OPT family oligopeptide transporter
LTDIQQQKATETPSKKLPEITVKAVILAIILTFVLCASNAYLGLKVGTTISASIPAAVISMGILRLFKTSNILENNIVQTAASVGEALVAGIAFVLPALLILGYWHTFHFWGTLIIALLGGALGMLFTIPVRRVMLEDKQLRYPEGTAIGMVLKASEKTDADLKPLMFGGLIGAVISLFQNGFKVIAGSMQYWVVRKNIVFGFGLGFSPALLAAGYIVGANVAVSTFLGVLVGWLIGVPILSLVYGVPHHLVSSSAIANAIWAAHLRYVGVGTMLVGGFWTIITLFSPIVRGLKSSVAVFKHTKVHGSGSIPRVERDIPINIMLWCVGAILFFVFLLLVWILSQQHLGLGLFEKLFFAAFATVFVLFAGFLFSSIAAYFAGLIGSTNSPNSGLIVSALLMIALLVLFAFDLVGHLTHARSIELAAFVIVVTSVVGATISIANDTMQDFKAGQIVGATPWKQQVMLVLGVVVASFAIAPILQLLFHAYGIGGVFPRPGMPVSEMLAAPQAGLMATVVKGIFSQSLPWAMIIAGVVVGVIAIIIDERLKINGWRLPVLAVGVGIYLPLSSSMPMVCGGLLSFIVNKTLEKRLGHRAFHEDKATRHNLHRALLAACGLVAGASIMGVLLAVPFAIERNANALRLVSPMFANKADIIAVIVTALLAFWLYRIVVKKRR